MADAAKGSFLVKMKVAHDSRLFHFWKLKRPLAGEAVLLSLEIENRGGTNLSPGPLHVDIEWADNTNSGGEARIVGAFPKGFEGGKHPTACVCGPLDFTVRASGRAVVTLPSSYAHTLASAECLDEKGGALRYDDGRQALVVGEFKCETRQMIYIRLGFAASLIGLAANIAVNLVR